MGLDRTRRQREADHAGREARIEAVVRDLLADVDYFGGGLDKPTESD